MVRWELSSQFQFLHGRPHQVNLPVHNYIGCGWSSFYTLDFPCLSGDLDDKIFMMNNKFTAVGVEDGSHSAGDGVSSNNNNNDLMTNTSKHNDKTTTTTTTTTNLILHDQDTSSSSPLPFRRPNGGSLPLCTVDTELADRSKGRWVRHALPNTTTSCPKGMKTDPNHTLRFDIIEHDPDHPHCWHREVLKTIGNTCREANCKFIDRSSMYSSEFKQQHDETNYWYGVWRQDSCDYLEFTDRQLQQCIDKRKISNITMVGTSIASFLSEYLSQRLQHIQFYDNSNNTDEGRFVKVSTLGLVHYCHDPDETFRTKLPTRAAKKGDKQENDHNTEVYIVTGPFASSERETHVHADRIDEMNRVVQEILGPKGYNFLEFFDLSAAFTYAASTQMDGMHIVGPPMKMIITKLFHYMCKDFVEGSIV